jgi:hypothetical protein
MAKAKEVKQEVKEEATTAPTPEEQIEAGNKQLEQLTVNDLIVIKNVFDVCSQRGAFKAEEFQTVGQVYTKLSNFLNAIMPPPAEETAEDATGEEETQGES